MNFLQRLHPGRALEPGAVRPDIAPRFVPPGVSPGMPAPAAPARPGPASTVDAAVDTAATTAPHAPPLSHSASPAAAAVLRSSNGQPPPREGDHPQPHAAQPAAPRVPVHGAQAAVVGPVAEHAVDGPGERSTPVRAAAPAPLAARPAAPMPVVPVAPMAPRARAANVQRSAVPRAHATSAPLRAQALPRQPAAPVPTVVRVSIDRLDVRLPAPHAAAASPAPQRPQAGAAGPTLADYLRGKTGGGP